MSPAERIAVVETKVDQIEIELEKQTAILTEISRKLNKQAGFISGAMFVLTGLVGAVSFLVHQFWK